MKISTIVLGTLLFTMTIAITFLYSKNIKYREKTIEYGDIIIKKERKLLEYREYTEVSTKLIETSDTLRLELKELLKLNNNKSIVIFFPNGACGSCLTTLLEEPIIQSIPKDDTHIISESENIYLKENLYGRDYKNYTFNKSIFKHIPNTVKIIISKIDVDKGIKNFCFEPKYKELLYLFI